MQLIAAPVPMTMAEASVHPHCSVSGSQERAADKQEQDLGVILALALMLAVHGTQA